ncbi:MAG: glucose-1-phosphate adenylyltransferase [Rhodocyclaceae bacterium]|nr:glucose-1-phosphate adenylyltransferase [Rhodocyclaceae bacterium]MBX3670204.1 glucose-1-phosphate adenylyltransferase [Rhodocyclaceae bacterium]
MITPRILAIVLAGGEGTRLAPLTAERSKPAVPFAGRYRIVDFVLSNLVNSHIHSIYLLVQYKSQSLIEHIRRSWMLSPMFPEQFITVVPPQMRGGPEWFQGTADAVYQNINLIEHYAPDIVAIFGADHIYRMDIRQMVDFHRAQSAEVSVAALPVPASVAQSFGVIEAEADGRIRAFLEKPANPPSMPGRPGYSFASMGNYLFDAEVLVDALTEAARQGHKDFGRDLLPRLCTRRHVHAYDFTSNHIPGLHPGEQPGYWRDVGTLDAYFDAHFDLLGMEPRFNLFNPSWRIGSSNYQGPTPKIVRAEMDNCILGAGCLIKGAKIRNSILRREIVIEEDVELDECIVMDYSVIRRGARLRRVIVDRYNDIPPNSRIGFDAVADAARYHRSDSGIVVIAKRNHKDGGAAGEPPRYL